MKTPALLMLLASAVLHAWWNYLIKRDRGGSLFIGLSKVAEAVVLAPLFLFLGAREALAAGISLIPLVAVGAALTLTNYVMLSIAYRKGDLSYVYPVSRGSVLLFLPILGALVFNERPSRMGWAALALIVAGIGTLQLPTLTFASVRGVARRLATSPATGFALLAALAAAGYTTWDKHAIQTISALTYFYLYTVLVAVAYAAFIVRTQSASNIRAGWSAHRGSIVAVGVCNALAYLLVLAALRDGTSSYVIALRQLSVAFGALLGWRLLKEEFGAAK